MNLLDKLGSVAAAWVDMHRRTDTRVTLRTLGFRASANSKLFDRKGMNVETYERVLVYLGEPSNWPAALVPADAAATLEFLGVTVPVQNRVGGALAA